MGSSLLIKIALVVAITLVALVIVTIRRGRKGTSAPRADAYTCPVCDETDCICHRHDDPSTQ